MLPKFYARSLSFNNYISSSSANRTALKTTCLAVFMLVCWSNIHAQFTKGNLVVVKPQGNTNAGTAISLMEYTSTGTLVDSVVLPSTTSGARVVMSGSATSEGFPSLSAELDRLVVVGYDAALGTSSVASTSSTTNNRVICHVDHAGTFTFDYEKSVFSGNNIRGGSAFGSNYFAAGAATGIILMNGGTTLSSTSTNNRVLQIVNGNVYFTTGSGSSRGLWQMGSGISTSTGQTSTVIANQASSGNTEGFAISPDGNTLYMADGSAGILKYTRTGGIGSFTIASYTVYATNCSGIAVDFSTTNPTIYATTADGLNLIKLVDAGSLVTTSVSSLAIATTASTLPFRGVTFAPSAYASVSGTTSICTGTSTTITFKGNPYGVVSYNINGGSTLTTTLDMTGTSSVSTGTLTSNATYNLISINNPSGTTTVSGSAVVSVGPAPITGTGVVCAGSATNLSDTTDSGAGTWSSTTSTVATVGTSGTVTGVSAGTSTISYTYAGCSITQTVTVNPLPASISGTANVCVSSTTTLTDATGGGSWTSGVTGVATIGTGSGIVSGISAGTSTISYTLGTGCLTNAVVTVNPLPASILGTAIVCVGLATTLTDGTSGGSWTSGTTGIAMVGTGSGTVTGVSAGTSTITYVLGTGCIATQDVTVNPLPTAISGTTGVCVSSTTALSDATGGGSWSSGATGVATIGTGSSVVSGVSAGTSTITYTLGSGCIATTIVTVNPLPASISGTMRVCVSSATTLTDGTSGGSWTSGTTGIATVGTGSGIVSGISAGTSTITYALGTGCIATQDVTVNPLPTAILGTTGVCASSTTTLTDATGGGSWSAETTGVATIGTGSGVVGGVSAGTSTITYALGSGCIATTIVTVNPLPASISGTMSVCVSSATTLTDGTSGGSWASGTTSIATVGSGSGTVSGVSAGTSTITYVLGTGCIATQDVTVNPLPTAILGTTGVCVSSTTTLTDATIGGSWSSGTTGVATIGTGSGIVSGVSAGTSTITYTLGSGCIATTIVTVNPLPASISGTMSVCISSATTLTDGTSGGSWTSGTTGIASVGTGSGIVSGVSAGTSTITYALGTGCLATQDVTVNPLPTSILGTISVCVSSTTTLTDATSGGSWSSGTTGVATIGTGSGAVSGLSAGTSTITYTLGTGCLSNIVVTVNPLPTSILGTMSVCVSSTTTLTDGTGGGSWTSGATSVATIGTGSGTVSGISAGTSTITYTLATGCIATGVVTVNPLPTSILGTMNVCASSATTLTDATGGGSWASGSTGIATIGTGSGTVSGIASGTSTITYTLLTGCIATAAVTVNPLPGTISGTMNICVSSLTALTDGIGGGSWASGSTGIATVGTGSGAVSGLAAGTSTITYTLGTGCIATSVVTVNPLPTSILGTTSACAGSITTLTDATAGGSWTSGATGVATAGTGTGTVSGIAAGTSSITYTLGTSCIATTIVTVNPLPAAISGTANVCVSSATTLTDAAGGGSWASAATTVATIGTGSGTVNGVTPGTSTITYTLGTGCIATTNVTVNPLPTSILGATSVCVSSTTTLTDATGGGSWTCNATGVATVGTGSGLVTGISGGTATITYTLGTGCIATIIVTVNPLPTSILGKTSVCISSTTTLSDATGGGSWASATTGVATIGSGSGIVSGLSAGTSTITYTLGTGCLSSTVVTVNPLPTSVLGTLGVCVSSTTALTDATGGGNWTSGTTGVATVGTGSGVVSGVSAGTATISYTLGTGCLTSAVVTVNPLPASISGTTSLCVGSTTTLTDATIGGTWSSGNTTIATIDPTGFVIAGSTVGTTTITYALPAGCLSTSIVTVTSGPSAITAISPVCIGSPTTFSDAGGGTWTSSNTSVATVGSTGVVSGVSTGTSTITYSLGSTCFITSTVTINSSVGAITGTTNVCAGLSTALTDGSSGGTWSSSNTTLATVVAGSGVVSGVAAGTPTISYILSAGCISTIPVTVNPLPAAIGGITSVCMGLTTGLSDGTPGGTWSSGATAVATIGAGSGLITSVATGTSTITYALNTGCIMTTPVTVNPLPASISGATNVCVSSTTTLTDATGGGSWISGSTGVATAGTGSGIVSGITAGTSVITYSLNTGCINTAIITVNPLPATIGGTAGICAGSTTTLSDATAFGAWSSSNSAVASVGSSTGVVTGATTGSATITYALTTGCTATASVTVNPLPTAILGTGSVCAGLTTTLTDAAPGGSWSSSNTSLATVGTSSGIVNGIVAGNPVITYTSPVGCIAVTTATVNPLPLAIIGIASVCAGVSTNLTDATTGGAWSSGTTAVATVVSGVVNGLTAGTATITYSLPTTCIATTTVTVNPLPANVSGTATVCAGLTTALTDATAGGTWSSGNVTLATVGSGSGVVTGVAAGTPTITYALTATGCFATQLVTVNPLPVNITGSPNVCAGLTIALTDASPGGTWSSSTTGIATIGSTGVVAGVAAGTSTITYTLPSGCINTAIVTVNPLPSVISGTLTICANAATTLGDTTPFGDWSSSNTAVATIGSASGAAIGVATGTATITYSLSTGCIATTVLTLNPVPVAINAITFPFVCVGSTIGLNDASGFGVWSSSSTAIAVVGTGTGVVTGVSSGVPNISYTFTNGCFVTFPVTVNPLPSAINGITAVCVGSGSTLSDTGGGTWTSSTSSIATINSATGVVTTITAGTTTITYTLPTGCIATALYTVNPFPSGISGTTSVCVSSTTNLADATPFGEWSSSNTAVASIGSGTGIVNGITAGTTTVTYALTTGCVTTTAVTVNSLPASISGTLNVCSGLTTILTDATGGGSWASSNIAQATIGSSTGLVTGVAAGTPLMSYILPTGCTSTAVMTVNALPVGITGTANVCVGLTTSLTDATTGGTWSSSSTSIASVGSTGIVNGVTAGSATVTYTLPTGCIATTPVIVNPLPAGITGTTNVCAGLTTSLSDATLFGAWASGSTGIATVVAGTGLVTGVAAGTTTITYLLATGCIATTAVTVNPLPVSVAGSSTVCAGLNISLSDASTGGSWASSATAMATIGSSTGLVNGVSAGSATITYTLPTGCIITKAVTVNPLPANISGTTNVCTGLTTTLSDATLPGTWSSSDVSLASVGATTGVVTGLSTGTPSITYILGTGCIAITQITVNPLPAVITGTMNVCTGLTTALTDASTGGGWSSSNTTVATVVSGVVNGVTPGTATITYTLPTGCITTSVVTVNPLPLSITGTNNVCVGSATPLADVTLFGAWSSSNTSIATVVPGTGVVSGVLAGSATITYTLATGCIATAALTVNPLPLAITGTATVCNGLTTSLTDGSAGGSWSSANTLVANVGSGTGIVTGISAGITTITYILTTGCTAVRTITINPLPVAISGPSEVCAGLSIGLSDATSGGSWTSGNTAVATVGTGTGVVTGILSGTATITYTLPVTGCIMTTVITVNPLPSAISGTANICAGLTTTLSDAGGGTWSSGNLALANIGTSSGVVTGIAAGTPTITYTLPTGCSITTTVTVNPLPSAISGTMNVCAGLTTTLSDVGGGTWSSSNTSVATVVSGLVTGVSAGTTTITYTLPTGCITTSILTVNPLPSGLAGLNNVCAGLTTSLNDPTPFGQWSSSNTALATIGSGTGLVTGVSAGTLTFTYSLSTGCVSTLAFTVNPLPTPILGTPVVCAGLTTMLSDGATGGTWSSSNTSIAGVVSGTGLVTGVSAGTATITYILPTGCIITTIVKVNPLPAAITGAMNVCAGLTTLLSDATVPGSWSSSNTATAMVNPGTGLVTAISAGTLTITYTIPTGCIVTTSVLVNPLPGALTGTMNVCAGLTTALSDATPLGTWSSSDGTLAAIGSSSGIVTGVSAGNPTITYTLPTGCIMTSTLTVNPLPASITGTMNVCAGLTTALSDVTSFGTWSSGDATLATIGSSSGVVTGVSAGTPTITYMLPTGCIMTSAVTVNPLPAAITGAMNVCAGLTTVLSDITPSGVWSSSDVTLATVGSSSGNVTGVSAGRPTITYTVPTGCIVTSTVTVNQLPAVITGTMNVCAGLTTALSDTTALGTWSSSNTALATIDITGLVTGVSGGSLTITYALPTGCIMTTMMTVNPLPAAITGHVYVCEGLSTALSDATPSGTWSSSDLSLATVGSTSGLVSAIHAGALMITYMLPTGCISTQSVLVSPTPVPMTGAMTVCAGMKTTLSDGTVGGVWRSGTPAIATVDSLTGIVSGIAAGTSVISYSYALIPTGCIATAVLSVNPLPALITGIANVCAGGSVTSLSDSSPGGSWSSSDATVRIGTSSGIVTGITAGTATVTYTLPTSCMTTSPVAINPLPSAISGSTNVCPGLSIALSDGTAGGNWSSPAYAGIVIVGSSTGFVTGVSAGTALITYKLPTGCMETASVTVNPLPTAITGAMNVCAGLNTTLTDAGGGTWSSSNTLVATIALGVVSGITAGTTAITYTLPTGCTRSTLFTVNPLPSAISGSLFVCQGATTALSDAGGGSWTSGNTSVATVISGTGVVGGVFTGTAAISYTLPTGCMVSSKVTVNPLPTVYAVTGGGSYCAGGTGRPANLSNSDPGFTYVLYDGVSPVDTLAGIGTGLSFGLQTPAGIYSVVSKNDLTGCTANMSPDVMITINPLPVVHSVTGGGGYCAGGAGVAIGLDSSDIGIKYQLYNGVARVDTPVNGTDLPLNYGLQTAAGVYKVVATNKITGCGTQMSDSAVISITPLVIPSVSFHSTDHDTVCLGTTVTFTAVPVNGGLIPIYQWSVNGINTGFNSPAFTYVPVDGDVVVAQMTSTAACPNPVSANNEVTMIVDSIYVPIVTISANPGALISKGQSDTLTAIVTEGGPAPAYQWYKNGNAIAGATNVTYVSSTFANNDSVTCKVTGSAECGQSTFNSIVMQVTTVGITGGSQSAIDIKVIPNPNKGIFTVSGSIATTGDEEVSLQLTDLLGQVIYNNRVLTHDGTLNDQVQLSTAIANGMYLLNVNTRTGNRVFHIVIEQ